MYCSYLTTVCVYLSTYQGPLQYLTATVLILRLDIKQDMRQILLAGDDMFRGC